MGATQSTVRPISFVSPRLLSTDRLEEVEEGYLWIYFPPVGFNTQMPYPNTKRGWWIELNREEDIANIKRSNTHVFITFKPGQAIPMNIPKNDQLILLGTVYPVTSKNDQVTIRVPYTSVDTN